MSPERLLKVRDVAVRLNCSDSNVYALVKAKRIRCFRVGRGRGGIRFSEAQVAAYLAAAEQGDEPKPVPPRVTIFRHLDL